jgi:hypothetical protein
MHFDRSAESAAASTASHLWTAYSLAQPCRTPVKWCLLQVQQCNKQLSFTAPLAPFIGNAAGSCSRTVCIKSCRCSATRVAQHSHCCISLLAQGVQPMLTRLFPMGSPTSLHATAAGARNMTFVQQVAYMLSVLKQGLQYITGPHANAWIHGCDAASHGSASVTSQ